MARVTWIGGIQIAMTLVMLAAAILRPPGFMLDVDDGTVSYVICTGDGIQTISVPVDGEHDVPELADPECAFFASQIAALPNLNANAARISVGALISQSQFISDLHARQPARLSNAVRAPPLGTELS